MIRAHNPAADAAVRAARPAHSHDEFSRLREVIIGDPTNAQIPTTLDRSAWLNLYGDLPFADAAGVRTGAYSQRVIEETREDLSLLVSTLEQLDVVVRRPEVVDQASQFGTPEWRSDGFHCYCPRDLALVIGSCIIEAPSPMRARYFELFSFRHIFQHYLESGSSWLAAPRPRLADELYVTTPTGHVVLGDSEPVFEAANVIRCGRDLFFQISSSGNEAGFRWFQSLMRLIGDYRVHPLRGLYDLTHIDSTIALLRPGLVLLNPERIQEATVPEALSGWDVIWCPPMVGAEAGVPMPLSSPWVGMNLLMVDTDLAIVDALQVPLMRCLESHGISVIPLRLRHARALGGGFHCVSLDMVRDGELTDYLR